MNILIVGSGGREHAFAWKLKQSPKCESLYIAPGNAGTAQLGENLPFEVTDFDNLGKACLEKEISLVVVGPEVPLVEGITDYFREKDELKHILIVGPDAKGAQLEGSKDFSKAFMVKHGIPTASARTFSENQIQEAVDYVSEHSLPVVLKADGLAAGKGVVIAQSKVEAVQTIHEMLVNKKFGSAGAKVIVEQFLSGIELSVFILTDGNSYLLLPEAKDYKRIGEGDTGPNTGGMGAVSPVVFADKGFMEKVKSRIIDPTVKGLKQEGIDYCGFIFFGLINVKGDPYVIEYNARMGDPETEVVLPRISSDLVDLLEAAARKELSGKEIVFESRACTTVMLVAGGYPEAYEKGKVISGLDIVSDVIPFHAGTKFSANQVVTNGGRVIALSALDSSWETALEKSNKAAEIVNWENKYYRRDIGFDLRQLTKKVVI